MPSKIPPKQVQTQAEQALSTYPELGIEGYEECSKVFALVAAALGQPPASSGENTSGGDGKRREWVRRLGCVFEFEILPQPSISSPFSKTTSPPTKPVHIYLDMLHTGLITLTPPKSSHKHNQHIIISVTSNDLVKIATGEKLPIRLYQSGRLKIKGDIDKSLLLGNLLRVARSQIYHPSTPTSSSSFHGMNRDRGEGPTHRDELTGEGLQGQGSGSGDIGVGLGAGGRVSARL